MTVVLPPSCTAEDWDLADAPGADGWDLADADWTPAQAMAHLKRHRRQVQRPEHPPDPQGQATKPQTMQKTHHQRRRQAQPQQLICHPALGLLTAPQAPHPQQRQVLPQR